ncbi:universal stress protein [Nitrosovibrio tenuis]|uniref:Nucleotide-binding universal stress protein, UspA family n=1 Tax=Nitrosovibrio tenuis TaxID=1233 RepID=A0A1H7H2N0_9PROT|nr:universal stress protein [Nitrosovibrio tenuis]SEK44559.1 Nucleotide-binding universal stress protein, UspA family [Nitrosovibrio tenuis]
MYRKVMVAIGSDETSPFALQEALHIASTDGAQLCIVHAAAKADDEENKNQRAGADLLGQAASAASAVPRVETRLLNSDGVYGLNGIAEVIANAAAEWGAELLVVGTKGRRGLERLVIGSVAEKLVQTVEISILLVRPH